MKKQKFRTASGITLVALVVTIIVLLILAGVSLNLVGGSNGILGRAQKAAKKTEIARFLDSKELSDGMMYTDMLTNGSGYSNLYDYIKDKCEENNDKTGDRLFEGDHGTYWIDDDDNLHFKDDVTGDDATVAKGSEGELVVKEIITSDGSVTDMTTKESLEKEIEAVLKELKEEYKKSGETGSFKDFVDKKIEEGGGELKIPSTGGTIKPNGDGTYTYEDATTPPNTGKIIIDGDGNTTITDIKINKPDGSGEGGNPSKTEQDLKNELDEVINDLKDQQKQEGNTDPFKDYLEDKINGSSDGKLPTSTGGSISKNEDGTYRYEDTSTPPNTVDFDIDEDGNVIIKNIQINNPGGTTKPNINLTVGDIIFQYSDESEWTNQVTVTAVPKEGVDITGYTLQTSRNGVTWNNNASQTFTSNGTFYVRLYNGSKYGAAATANVTNVDGVKPVVTALTSNTNSLTFTATDETSGIVGYSVTESATAPSSFEACDNTKTLTKTIEGTQGKTYYIWIKDEAGNVSEGKSVTLGEVQGITTADINFTYSDTEWTNQNVTVTAAPKEGVDITGYTMQVSTDGTNWTDGNSHEFEANGSLYVSLRDAAGQRAKTMATANVEKIDKNAPEFGTVNVTTNSFSFKITEPAEESGLAGYEITETDVEPTSFESINGTEFETTVSNKKNDKTYYIWAKDIAGGVNKKTVNLNPVLIPTEGDLTATTSSWSGTTATVTFSTTTSYEIQYTTKQSTDDKDWNTGTSTTVESGTTIFVRLWDGVNGSTTKISHRPVLTYTVTYNGNGNTGGSTATSTHNYGEAKALTANGFSKTGYTFAGWNTAANGSGTNYSNSQSVTDLANTQGANVTLYAKWTINQYTLTFNTNGGSGGPGTQTKTYGVNMTISSVVPTRDGYVFKGWSTSNTGTAQYQPGETYEENENVTLYAVWSNLAVDIISAQNYGEAANYTSANGISSWQIFLNEGGYIYLIAADYVPTSGMKITSDVTKVNGSDYKIKGNSRNGLVSWLTTASNWSNYATGTSGGNTISGATATGGPTKQQFCSSYNAKYGTSHPNGLGSGTYFTVTNKVAPYIITDTSKANAYWLASASSAYSIDVWDALYDGYVYSNGYGQPTNGVRPLVRLPSGIKAQKSGSTWVFSN